MTVQELLVRISSTELAEWMAFYRSDPFGERRADYRAALVTSMIANVNRGRNKRPYKVDEFLLRFGERPKMTGEQSIKYAKAWASALGGTVVDKRVAHG